ncbi:MAG TPA: efflux RND transporter periplasmic adaptor subunit [Acidobacteriaceae bacterium]|nr:efflux RND transporter periplasmic adaptor subunit [Acidobacteriaceae bacterium]
MNADITTSSPANGDPRPEGHPQRRLLWILIGIVVLGVALLVGWLPRHQRDKEVNDRAEKQQNALPIVDVQTVHSASSTQDLTLPGTVTALRIAHIYGRASGYLKTRYVDLGDTVHKGQLLAIISAPDLDATVAQQAGTVQQSRDNVQTAQSNLALQQATYTRVHTLVLHGILSQQDDDTARAAVETAQSNLHAMQNAVKSAQGALAHEQSLADFEQIRSPIDGTITARNVEVGNLVSATGAAQGLPAAAEANSGGPPTGGAQGGELFDVVDLRSLEVFVSVPEQNAPFVQTGQSVNLSVSELPGQTFTGKVVRSSDSLSQQTRTLLAEVKIDDAQHRLRPGMFASVQMHYVAPNPGILISGDSLLTLARGQFVPVVENNVIQMRPVRVGRDLGTQVYVTSGLHDGDLIVVNPNDAVQQGLRVNPRPAPAGQQGADESSSAGAKDK